MSDLVKRLREQGKFLRDATGGGRNSYDEAADEIERLTAERDEARSEAASHRNGLAVVAAKRDDLASQVAALREALVKCANIVDNLTDFGTKKLHPVTDEFVQDGARVCNAALTDTAAAARECERRLRIEGAEAVDEEWRRVFGSGLTEMPRKPAAVVDAKWPAEVVKPEGTET